MVVVDGRLGLRTGLHKIALLIAAVKILSGWRVSLYYLRRLPKNETSGAAHDFKEKQSPVLYLLQFKIVDCSVDFFFNPISWTRPSSIVVQN